MLSKIPAVIDTVYLTGIHPSASDTREDIDEIIKKISKVGAQPSDKKGYTATLSHNLHTARFSRLHMLSQYISNSSSPTHLDSVSSWVVDRKGPISHALILEQDTARSCGHRSSLWQSGWGGETGSQAGNFNVYAREVASSLARFSDTAEPGPYDKFLTVKDGKILPFPFSSGQTLGVPKIMVTDQDGSLSHREKLAVELSVTVGCLQAMIYNMYTALDISTCRTVRHISKYSFVTPETTSNFIRLPLYYRLPEAVSRLVMSTMGGQSNVRGHTLLPAYVIPYMDDLPEKDTYVHIGTVSVKRGVGEFTGIAAHDASNSRPDYKWETTTVHPVSVFRQKKTARIVILDPAPILAPTPEMSGAIDLCWDKNLPAYVKVPFLIPYASPEDKDLLDVLIGRKNYLERLKRSRLGLGPVDDDASSGNIPSMLLDYSAPPFPIDTRCSPQHNRLPLFAENGDSYPEAFGWSDSPDTASDNVVRYYATPEVAVITTLTHKFTDSSASLQSREHTVPNLLASRLDPDIIFQALRLLHVRVPDSCSMSRRPIFKYYKDPLRCFTTGTHPRPQNNNIDKLIRVFYSRLGEYGLERMNSGADTVILGSMLEKLHIHKAPARALAVFINMAADEEHGKKSGTWTVSDVCSEIAEKYPYVNHLYVSGLGLENATRDRADSAIREFLPSGMGLTWVVNHESIYRMKAGITRHRGLVNLLQNMSYSPAEFGSPKELIMGDDSLDRLKGPLGIDREDVCFSFANLRACIRAHQEWFDPIWDLLELRENNIPLYRAYGGQCVYYL